MESESSNGSGPSLNLYHSLIHSELLPLDYSLEPGFSSTIDPSGIVLQNVPRRTKQTKEAITFNYASGRQTVVRDMGRMFINGGECLLASDAAHAEIAG